MKPPEADTGPMNVVVAAAPEVRYAKSGEVNIAYATVGDGPFDLVFVGGWVLSNLAVAWEGPPADFFRRLASFCRLILFDKRGTGLSDRTSGIPDLETRMDDIRAVMDAVGSTRAAILGVSEGGPMTLLFAATYPERTAAAILYGSGASFKAAEDYSWGRTPAQAAERIRFTETEAGTDEYLSRRLDELSPSLKRDQALAHWWGRWVRTSASPGAIVAMLRMNLEIDTRHTLPLIHVPTLILHPVGDRVFEIGEARYMADRIAGAELVEMPLEEHGWWMHAGPIASEVERFLVGLRERGEWESVVEPDRVLATVLFTDIVGSTEQLAQLGDRRWRELLGQHHALVRRQIARFRGRELGTAGDGFFATFDGPARGIRCARAITEGVRELGLEVRAGLHTGETEVSDGQIGGIAVHIGARVAAEAGPGEVLVSSTVKDLVAGSGIKFAERGAFDLKGVPGRWQLYTVEGE